MELSGIGFGINSFSTYIQFSEKLTFLPSDAYAPVLSGGRKVNFLENLRAY